MADVPLPWRAYASLQSSLDTRTSVDATSSGMEAGLNHLLDEGIPRADGVDLDRIVASAARRDRYARSLRAKYIIISAEVHEHAGQIEARSSLGRLQRVMPTDKLDFLVELASGTELADLAAKRRIAVGAMRTRIARARQFAREMEA